MKKSLIKRVCARYTVATFLADCGMPIHVAAAGEAVMSIHKLVACVRDGDLTELKKLPGVAEKRAMKIAKHGLNVIARFERAECRHWHYMAPAFTWQQMLDPCEREMLDRLLLEESPTYRTLAAILEDLIQYERERVHIPFSVEGPAEYNALPSSMLADKLGIHPGDVTNKLCLYKHSTSHVGKLPDNLEMPSWQKANLRGKLDAFRFAFLERAERSGFVTAKGEAYMLFTHSPSQLKKESGYFMLKEEAKRHASLFWYGMSPSELSAALDKRDKQGNLVGTTCMTKLLQWRALLLSAAIKSSDVFNRKIDMTKIIVVPKMEKMMTANVMSVSPNYDISEGVRSDISNPLWDGQSILNARIFGFVVAQLRAIGFKSLGVGVDVAAIAKKRGYSRCIVTDVEGVAHDLEKEEWHLITDANSFKMLKAFGTLQHYFGVCRLLDLTEGYVVAVDGEEKEINTISRQMLSSLFDLSDDELIRLCHWSMQDLHALSSVEGASDALAERELPFDRKSNIGKLATAVEDLIALPSMKDLIEKRYVKNLNRARAGKLRVNGKYLFAVLDPVAWVDVYIGGRKPDDPDIGFLRSGEVACSEYKSGAALACLRSPHAAHEWHLAKNMRQHVDVAPGCIVFNVHDLAFRVMQMDFDGDHILVVDSPWLTDRVRAMQKKYDIPVLYYDACEPASIDPIPLNRSAFSDQVAKCVIMCADYNRVGQYSTYVCRAWSLVPADVTKSEFMKHYRRIAVLTAAINAAVDAQKKGAMNKLPREYYADLDTDPYNQRYHRASKEHPSSHPSWDKSTLPLGSGVVDRACLIVGDSLPEKIEIEAERAAAFDWTIMCDDDPRFKPQINSAVLPEHIADIIRRIGVPEGKDEHEYYVNVLSGRPITLKQLFRLMSNQSTSFFAEYERLHEDDYDAEGDAAKMKSSRSELIKRIFVEFTRASCAERVANMSDEEIAAYVAQKLLCNTFASNTYDGEGNPVYNNNWQMVNLARWFGDILADVALRNRVQRLSRLPADQLAALTNQHDACVNEQNALFDSFNDGLAYTDEAIPPEVSDFAPPYDIDCLFSHEQDDLV